MRSATRTERQVRRRYAPAFASTTTETPRAGIIASAFWYECGRLPGNASTSPAASS